MIVISLGGSLIVPDEIDVGFLKKFRRAILEITEKESVIVICGGGKVSRKYQQAVSSIVKPTHGDLDWLGIKATFMNAQLLKIIMGPRADRKVYKKPEMPKHKITVAAGWLPGWSTDYDAVLWAKKSGAKKVINMSNIDFLYDKDPKKFPDAKRVREMKWADYRKIAGDKWTPGLNLPFDPIASRLAHKAGMKVYIIGKDIGNLKKAVEGKPFRGSIIC